MWEIDQIERTFHEATTTKDIDLMLSLWAPNATLTVGPGRTATGIDEIRQFWLEKSTAFMPVTHWVSDHPAYKLEITLAGDRGTLHFECHYIDYDSEKLALATVADLDVARIDGRWLITNLVAGSTTWPPESLSDAGAGRGRPAVAESRRPLSRGYDPLVRAVGRLPAKVSTKLLIAFLGTSLLLVTVGLFGQRVLGQSNDRVGSLGALQERAFAYGQLQRDAWNVRALLSQTVGNDFYDVWPVTDPGDTADPVAVDRATLDAAVRLGAMTNADRLGFAPPAEDADTLRSMRTKAELLSTLMTPMIELEEKDRETARQDRRGRRGAAREWALADPARADRAARERPVSTGHQLSNLKTAQIDDLIALNASSFKNSRNLVIGVAVGAIVLALLLGFVLAWSVIGPIQRIDARLAGIASGDFSGHVGRREPRRTRGR
jgi:ketosteroid isomerase-like protein